MHTDSHHRRRRRLFRIVICVVLLTIASSFFGAYLTAPLPQGRKPTPPWIRAVEVCSVAAASFLLLWIGVVSIQFGNLDDHIGPPLKLLHFTTSDVKSLFGFKSPAPFQIIRSRRPVEYLVPQSANVTEALEIGTEGEYYFFHKTL